MLTNGFDFEAFYINMLEKFTEMDLWIILLNKVLIIVGIIIGVVITKRFGHALIQKVLSRKHGKYYIKQRRILSLGNLLKNALTSVLSFIGVLLILEQLGINLLPLLAGAGVIGLAVAFGAQSLVRDFITGIFIIFEDQFAVGDWIRTGSFEGIVEEMGIRVTKIRAETGEVHIIPNGLITQITNFSTTNSISFMDVSIAYTENIKHAKSVLESLVKEVYEDGLISDLVTEPKVLGIQSVNAATVSIRIKAECNPLTSEHVTRAFNELIKERLEHENISVK